MPDVVMPRLSDSMEEGTIVKWLVEDGATVARGDEIVEIETDKATMTYEADSAGVISILAPEGETLAIGQPIARIGEGGDGAGPTAAAPAAAEPEAAAPAAAEPEAAAPAADQGKAPAPAAAEPQPPAAEEQPAPAAPTPTEPAEPTPSAPAPATAAQPTSAPSDGHGAGAAVRERVKASPIARRMARERGLDLSGLTGSGPGGRIVKADVEAAGAVTAPAAEPELAEPAPAAVEAPPAEAPAPAAAPAEAPAPATAKGEVRYQELSRTQQTIARRMAESRATVPDFTLQADVDMEQAVEGRAALKAAAGESDVVPSFNDLVVKACALALREFPRANGAYRDGRFELYSRVNVGVAVAAQDALVVPTVFDADHKGLGQIAGETRALAAKVREGTITPPELSGATFTVSNLGMYGIREFTAVINPPQAAILSVGALERRPVVRDGELMVRHTMSVALACDHRILYGADAAEFLAAIKAKLQAPLTLAL